MDRSAPVKTADWDVWLMPTNGQTVSCRCAFSCGCCVTWRSSSNSTWTRASTTWQSRWSLPSPPWTAPRVSTGTAAAPTRARPVSARLGPPRVSEAWPCLCRQESSGSEGSEQEQRGVRRPAAAPGLLREDQQNRGGHQVQTRSLRSAPRRPTGSNIHLRQVSHDINDVNICVRPIFSQVSQNSDLKLEFRGKSLILTL